MKCAKCGKTEGAFIADSKGNLLCEDCINNINKEINLEPASHAQKEMVNHPDHYQGNGIEVIDVIEAFNLGFNLGNAIKYILRAGKKGDRAEDLNKALWYVRRELWRTE